MSFSNHYLGTGAVIFGCSDHNDGRRYGHYIQSRVRGWISIAAGTWMLFNFYVSSWGFSLQIHRLSCACTQSVRLPSAKLNCTWRYTYLYVQLEDEVVYCVDEWYNITVASLSYTTPTIPTPPPKWPNQAFNGFYSINHAFRIKPPIQIEPCSPLLFRYSFPPLHFSAHPNPTDCNIRPSANEGSTRTRSPCAWKMLRRIVPSHPLCSTRRCARTDTLTCVHWKSSIGTMPRLHMNQPLMRPSVLFKTAAFVDALRNGSMTFYMFTNDSIPLSNVSSSSCIYSVYTSLPVRRVIHVRGCRRIWRKCTLYRNA